MKMSLHSPGPKFHDYHFVIYAYLIMTRHLHFMWVV